MSKCIVKNCNTCKVEFSSFQCAKRKFCSLSCSLKGNKNRLGKKHTLETLVNFKSRIPWNKGKKGVQKWSEESKLKVSKTLKLVAKRGPDNHAWKGGITSSNVTIRTSHEYRQWRRKIFQRDDYTCQECGQRGGELNADHIKPFAYYPELRFDLSNGRTLCRECHKGTDTFAYKLLKRDSLGRFLCPQK